MVAMGRVAPEVAKEHGLIPASRNEMLSELRSLFVDWEPWHQSFFMNHGCNFLVLAGMLPGYSYAKKFRWKQTIFSANSELGCCSSMFPGVARAPGRWLPVVLPVMVPAAVCGLTHDFYVTHDIFLQETPCTVCLETRATSLQVTLGAFLPFVSSVAGTLLLGHQMSLKWVPRTRSGSPNTRILWPKF